MSARELTPEQQTAVDRRDGRLLLAANAGSGKTTVLVERFVRSVTDDGISAGSILAITFTDKAAGVLRSRIRAALVDAGRRDLARDAEGAWISTIHGFCARVLRAHAVAAGLDPAFTVLDDATARDLRARAWDRAFAAFLGNGDVRLDALDLAAAWTPDRLRTAILAAHEALRSQGVSAPVLPPVAPPDLSAAHARLLAAARAARAALPEPAPNKSVERAAAALDACLDALVDAPVGHPCDVAVGAYKAGNATALKTDASRAYLDAHAAYVQACTDHAAVPARDLLDELLRAFCDHYEREKAAASAVDFEDLQLRTRDLLLARPAVREAYRARFARVMVDEFQDTNPLQVEILELIDGGACFRVGDALQSIYGFRHADVGGFRRARADHARTGDAATLATNWRSRPELLSTVNAAWGRAVHTDYVDLVAGRVDPADPAGPRVELHLVDTAAFTAADPGVAALNAELARGMPEGRPERVAEARAVAVRVRALVDARECRAGDVAILLRSASDMALYERALELAGLSTLASGGRGFWARQQVQDLCAWLTVLANPEDDGALYDVLASPLCGVSADGLARLALAARDAGGVRPWVVLRDRLGEAWATGLADGDRSMLAAARDRIAAHRGAAPRRGLDEVLEAVVDETAYDLATLRLPGGRRRLANVQKLLRLAADWEAAHGRDVRGLVDHAAAELEADAREPDAPVDLGGLEAVRLMTIHAAKGLEFPVVVVADLGRRGQGGAPDLLVDPGTGRVGIRLVGMDGGSCPALAHADLAAELDARAVEEERRILHVALTRAEERLILTGAQPLDGEWPRPSATAPPLAWMGPHLDPALPERLADEEVLDLDELREGHRLRVRVVRVAPDTAPQRLGAAVPDAAPLFTVPTVAGARGGAARNGRAAAAAPAADAADRLGVARAPRPEAAPPPAPRPPATLSYSQLHAYERCGYRYYVERILGLPRGEEPPRPGVVAADGLDALTRGRIAHALLEDVDVRRPQPPGADRVEALARRAGATLTDADREDLAALVAAWIGSPLRRRLAAAADVRAEHGFAFAVDAATPLLTGIVDLRARMPDGTRVVVDHKTDRLAPDADLDAHTEGEYGVQRRIYALAELRAGAPRVEVHHVYLDRAAASATAVFDASDADSLAAALAARAAPLVAGRYAVAPAERAGLTLCAGCPARGTLCTHPRAITDREVAPDDPLQPAIAPRA